MLTFRDGQFFFLGQAIVYLYFWLSGVPKEWAPGIGVILCLLVASLLLAGEKYSIKRGQK